ncbi:MAG: serine/threonine-protein kinase [Acidobacteriota bacterium]
MSLVTGSRLGPYEILSLAGSGGMGEVYRARDPKLNRTIAIKVLPETTAANPERRARFEREAQTIAALNHPNIVTIYSVEEADGVLFLTMEHVDGKSLGDVMGEGDLRLGKILSLAIPLADAISAAHQKGITHRDLKPANVMVTTDGRVKVLDFGLAKLVEPLTIDAGVSALPTEVTREGQILGTVSYMSPEQARGRAVDGRSDIWSLGVVLYKMVAGHPPFQGETSSHVIVALLEHEPEPLARFAPGAPAELQRIVRKCLMKERDDRYQTARDLMLDLKNLRRELEMQSELERPAAPHGTDAPTTLRGRAAPTHTDASAPAGPAQSIHDAPPPPEAGARHSSSAEYIATDINRHKKAVILIAVLATVAIAVSILLPRFRSERALTEKDTILLTDFVNTTGDPVFDGTLKQALAVQLGQSPFLNIFADDLVRGSLKFMGRSPDERVTRDVGREICQRQGLKAMLVGSIAGLGSHYVITLDAINEQTGEAIAREQVEADNKEKVLHALGDAAVKLRGKLGELLQSIQKFDAPIEQGTTTSLEAFKAFSLGVEQQLTGKHLEAIPFLRRAVEIDPNFALAYARMASIYYNSRQYDLAAEASQRAFELRGRVSERERLYISAGYYDNVTGELEKYLDTLELWKRTYPRHAPPHNNLALKYSECGRFAEAVEEAREAIRLNPNSASGYSLLAGAFVGLNRFDEAQEIIRQALARKLDTTAMHGTLFRIAFFQGDANTMKEQIAWVNGKPDDYLAQRWQGEAVAFSGRLREARDWADHAFELAATRGLKDVAAQTAAGAASRDALWVIAGW